MRVSSQARTNAVVLACLVSAGLAVAGCGKSATPAASGEQANVVSPTPPASGCGSFARPPLRDESGVIATLPKQYRDAYAGIPVQASKWASWKPTHPGPYNVQIVWSGLVNSFITDLQNDIKSGLLDSGKVVDVEVTNTNNNVDTAQQIQLLQSAIRKNPDLIVLLPLQPDAFTSGVEQAGARGIPVISVINSVPSPYAVSVDINSYLSAAFVTSILARGLHGKGSLLTVGGYPGTTPNDEGLRGVDAVLKNCPGMKKVGSVIGSFTNGPAKQVVTQFLATHPAPVAAAVQVGGMGPGVMDGFKSVGRPLPALGDLGASKGTLGHWLNNEKTFLAAGTGQSAPGTASAVVNVATQMLDGKGPRVNKFIPPVVLISNQNLKEWAKPEWDLSTPGVADGPPDSFMTDEYASRLFSNP